MTRLVRNWTNGFGSRGTSFVDTMSRSYLDQCHCELLSRINITKPIELWITKQVCLSVYHFIPFHNNKKMKHGMIHVINRWLLVIQAIWKYPGTITSTSANTPKNTSQKKTFFLFVFWAIAPAQSQAAFHAVKHTITISFWQMPIWKNLELITPWNFKKDPLNIKIRSYNQ